MRLYLAHNFDSRHLMRNWEFNIEQKLGIDLINPFYDLTREDIDRIDKGEIERYAADPNSIVNRDVGAIDSSDGIIAYINGDISYGTPMEIVYAKHLDKPVYILCTNGHEKHPWLVYHSDKITTTFAEMEAYLAEIGKYVRK